MFAPAITALGPAFERKTGHKLLIDTVTSPQAIKQKFAAGAAIDVGIYLASVIDDLVKAGKISAASRVNLARTGVGVGVRAGAPKPDVSTADAFKRTLLNAKSVAYATEGRSGRQFSRLLDRLGVAAQVKPKLKALTSETAIPALAKGEVEIAVLLIARIVNGAGVEFAGPIPTEFQVYLPLAAGVSSNAKQPDAANILIKYLTSPEAAPVIKAKGMEPGAR